MWVPSGSVTSLRTRPARERSILYADSFSVGPALSQPASTATAAPSATAQAIRVERNGRRMRRDGFDMKVSL